MRLPLSQPGDTWPDWVTIPSWYVRSEWMHPACRRGRRSRPTRRSSSQPPGSAPEAPSFVSAPARDLLHHRAPGCLRCGGVDRRVHPATRLAGPWLARRSWFGSEFRVPGSEVRVPSSAQTRHRNREHEPGTWNLEPGTGVQAGSAARLRGRLTLQNNEWFRYGKPWIRGPGRNGRPHLQSPDRQGARAHRFQPHEVEGAVAH